MKDLVRYVDSLSAEMLLRKGLVSGDYGIEGNKVELTQVTLQGNGVLVVTAQVSSMKTYITTIKLFVVRVKIEGREIYQFRIRTALVSLDLNLTPQGGQVGTADPIPVLAWPRGSLNITQLVIMVLKISKKINSNSKLNGRSENV